MIYRCCIRDNKNQNIKYAYVTEYKYYQQIPNNEISLFRGGIFYRSFNFHII